MLKVGAQVGCDATALQEFRRPESCSLPASEAVTAVTSYSLETPSFFGHAEVCLSCGVSSGVGRRSRSHGDDRVSQTDAGQRDDIFHSGSSELGGNLNSAEIVTGALNLLAGS
jgi:hypothetical protein